MNQPTDRDILRAIVSHFAASNFTWPTPLEICEQYGKPIHGLVGIIARLMADGKVAYDCHGSVQRVCVLLDPSRFDWHGSYDNVKGLGRWLQSSVGFTAEELQSYYESPYRWSEQFAAYAIWLEMQAESERAA